MKENKQEKSQIKQKILLYLSEKGVSAYEFYKTSGVTRGILTQNNGINEDNLSRFLAYAPDVSLDWLMSGRGEMLKRNVQQTHITPSEQPAVSDKVTEKEGDKQEKQVSFSPSVGTPYYDVDFHAGFDMIFNDQTTLPTCNVVVPGFEKACVWCNVTGHSMEPRISHGDMIALRECTLDDIQYGEIYAVVLDTIRTIKILRKGSTPKTLRYIPINTQDFDEQEYPIRRIIKIYEVIGSISRFF